MIDHLRGITVADKQPETAELRSVHEAGRQDQ